LDVLEDFEFAGLQSWSAWPLVQLNAHAAVLELRMLKQHIQPLLPSSVD
jgi:hypothetical protein